MLKSQFHYLRSRACVAAAVEQHANGAEGLAVILAHQSVVEGRCARIADRLEKSIANASQADLRKALRK